MPTDYAVIDLANKLAQETPSISDNRRRTKAHAGASVDRPSTLGSTLFKKKETGSKLHLERVHERDERVLVANTLDFPFSAVCALKLFFPHLPDRAYAGTGALISPNVILTCAHNFYDWKTTEEVFKVIAAPAQPAPHSFPFGEYEAKKVLYSKQYKNEPNANQDYGVIILDEPIGDKAGFFGILEAEKQDFAQYLLHVTGYPTMDQDGGTGKRMWTDNEPLTDVVDGEVRYYTDTSPGNSGSPVYFYEADNHDSEPSIVAVHSGGRPENPLLPTEYNVGAHLHGEVYDQVLEWIKIGKEYL